MTNKKPLIHCITNPISINQCANAILAVSAQPIMAEHKKEAAEITETADALLLNIGNITDMRMESMPIALTAAAKKNIPIVLDIVGLACSTLRKEFVKKLLTIATPTVIKGNYSEIFSLYSNDYRSVGVDSDASLSEKNAQKAALFSAKKYKCIILATGKRDIVTDGKRIVYVGNGTKQLSAVTGTGCMLGALCAAYLAKDNCFNSVVYACAVLGISGEFAKTPDGNGSFVWHLTDEISKITDSDVQKYMKTEEIEIDKT